MSTKYHNVVIHEVDEQDSYTIMACKSEDRASKIASALGEAYPNAYIDVSDTAYPVLSNYDAGWLMDMVRIARNV